MNNFACNHENDECTLVMVARPHHPSILDGNLNLKQSLYREPVNITRLHEQHEDMIDTLKKNNIKVIDLMSTVDPDSEKEINLANVIFTRDPILCTAKGVVLGRFREHVRRGETELTRKVLRAQGVPIIGKIRIPGYVEGGDFIPAGDRAFIAMGNRTNAAGIRQMLERDMFGTNVVAIVKYPEDGEMKAIHLDCYFGLVDKRYAIVWEHALSCVTVSEMKRDSPKAPYIETKTNVPFRDYLNTCGLEVIPVNDASQAKYGCNLLDIGMGRVLTQEEHVTQALIARGCHAIFVPFSEIHKMYGGIRCATQTLKRTLSTTLEES